MEICIICGNKFEKKRRTTGKYCSVECVHKSLQNRINVKCDECGKIYGVKASKYKNHKSKFFFCSRKCKDLAQSISDGSGKLTPNCYKTGKTSYKKRAMFKLENKCVDCGYIDNYLLVVHHKDGNRDNNNINNLEIVCHNCHAKRHVKFINGKLVYNPRWLTPRDKMDIWFKSE